ncbi:MAG: protease HtpX, partial [Candidatus Omnitrophica bacterium]|nr:protease HtpX [Candidatus Omnitrophota bacterium]
MNYVKTAVLLILLAALLIWIGGMIGGRNGMFVAFLFSLVLNVGTYWFSDKIVLAMYGAKQLDENAFPEIYTIVKELS